MRLLTKESLVVLYHHHGFNLLDSLKDNAHDDDQARSAEGNVSIENAAQENRQDSDNGESDCTDEDDVVEDTIQVLAGRFARTDAWNEAARLLQIIRNLNRIEGD